MRRRPRSAGKVMGVSRLLTRNHRQEALCRAYVQAVAAIAGVSTSVPVPDYGVDLSLREIVRRGQRYLDGRLQLDLQLRSTTRACLTDTHVGYDLEVEMHAFLRELTPIRCLLVVLVLPDDEALWLNQTMEDLVVRHCSYWYSLRGATPSTASSSVRVSIPRQQVFSAEAVHTILERLRKGQEA
jgi:hypothetical protein